MSRQLILTHPIQKHIIATLTYQKTARFRDLRPPKTDTNLFSYHLKALMKNKLVAKTDVGYSLDRLGLSYVDHMATTGRNGQPQPKIVTMLLVQNSDGQILVQRRGKQPYIDSWTLPYGKLHVEDTTLERAAGRVAHEKLGFANVPMRHAGDAYIRVTIAGEILSSTLAHIFRFETDEIKTTTTLQWVEPLALARLTLAPAVEQIVARAFFQDEFFFEQYEQAWLG